MQRRVLTMAAVGAAIAAALRPTDADEGVTTYRVVTAEDREAAALLMEMAAIYPGDPDGTLAREAAELLGETYSPTEVIVTFGEANG